ncbi:MAG: GTPase ObgE [Clostridia bacterium]|nr:GTPase ObgE [Clostridia bacterium]
MFVDRAVITIISGDGGNGCKSMKAFSGKPNGGPDGGDGGKGGDVIFKVAPDKNNLVDFIYEQHYKAENGENGGSNLCYGRSGKDVIIRVPKGTVIKDKETGKIIADMFYDDSEEVVLKGGRGGKGNVKFATSTRKAPHFAQTGEKGMRKQVILELKTIADVGFCGFPNVGKSTLLSVLTNARPKIANYHFTTLTPNLGAITIHDKNYILADIPGLIEGAAQGAGLGHDFLRHVERTRLIVHVVDISGIEGRDAYEDYKAIRKELKEFSEELYKRPEIIVANKTDSDFENANLKEFKKHFRNKKVIPISAITREGLEELKEEMFKKLQTLEEVKPIEFEKFTYEKEDASRFEIVREDNGDFYVFGPYIDNLARNVVLDNPQSLAYFEKSLKLSGVMDKLRRMGAKDGDTVRVLDVEFDFVD